MMAWKLNDTEFSEKPRKTNVRDAPADIAFLQSTPSSIFAESLFKIQIEKCSHRSWETAQS